MAIPVLDGAAIASAAERADYWACRLGGFLLLHVLDDPAWLALIFC